mgnify:FL=1
MITERIRDIRKEKDLRQIDVARILNVSQANYSRWENGTELMPLKKLTIFCNYFNVSMDYVIGITRNNTSTGTHELNSKTIGNNLKSFRKKYGITQAELANFLNTTHSTISAYESGKTTLLTAFAIQIAKKYHISLDWLCGRTK